jgi:hypothetical protein
MKEKKNDFETQAGRNGWKGEHVSDLRKGATRTRANCALHQKKLIGPSCEIRFPGFLDSIEPEKSKVRTARKKIGFWKSGGEKRLKRWRCVRSEKGTDQDHGGLRSSPEKAHSSLLRYPISEFFGLNRTGGEQATQWNKKNLNFKLRRGETAEKVKICEIWGRDRSAGGRTAPFTRKTS